MGQRFLQLPYWWQRYVRDLAIFLFLLAHRLTQLYVTCVVRSPCNVSFLSSTDYLFDDNAAAENVTAFPDDVSPNLHRISNNAHFMILNDSSG